MKGLYFYKLVSPYENDITKDCKLTINEIDHNFLQLKNSGINSGEYIKDRKSIILRKNDGEEIVIELSSLFFDDESGEIINSCEFDLNYNKADGIIKIQHNNDEFIIDDIITKENIVDNANVLKELISNIYTDYSLDGNGLHTDPLKISHIEKTGLFKPVISFIDMDNGDTLPSENISKGDRYASSKSISEYGLLYDFNGVKIINEKLKNNGWRIPTKSDWDDALNTIEPCEYENHDNAINNQMLGKVAGKLLKSVSNWRNYDATIDDNITPNGTDSYGMKIIPAGYGFGCDPSHFSHFGDKAAFWTTTELPSTDVYTKVFEYSKSGVVQIGESPESFLSIRLIKDYNGNNHNDVECIGGVNYRTILMPNKNSENGYTIWTSQNLSLIIPECKYLVPNNGNDIKFEKHFYINEWDGFKWVIKEVYDGEGFVINKGLNSENSDDDYSLYMIINGELTSLSDFIINRVYDKLKITLDNISNELHLLTDKVNEEIIRSTNKDDELDSVISSEIERSVNKDTELESQIEQNYSLLDDKTVTLEKLLNDEINRSNNKDLYLETLINNEVARSANKDSELETLINNEVQRATSKESQLENNLNYADNRLMELINNEVSRSTNKDSELETLINNEVVRSANKDSELETIINNEINRSENEDTTLNNRLNSAINNMISQSNHKYDCANGTLTLQTNSDDVNDIIISLDSNYGTF